MSDLPDEAVEAALANEWVSRILSEYDAEAIARTMLTAAAPHMRAQVLAEVDATLRELDLNDLEMRFIHERLGK